MENELPKNWVETTFDDLTEIIGGGTPSSKVEKYYGGEIPWITPADLSGYSDKYILKGKKNITELGLSSSSARLLPKGTVLFSSRAPIGYVAIAANDLTTNQGFKSLIPNDYYHFGYAYYYLKSIKTLAESYASGTTFLELSSKRMKEIPFPLPPLPEQQRIVAKLDSLFGHLDQVKSRLEKIPTLLKNFRQAILTQAVTGKLTEEWREAVIANGKELGKWEDLKLNDLCSSITDGDHQAPPRSETGVPFLVISNVSKGYFDFSSVTRYVHKSYFESLKDIRVPQKGDVLYTVTGSYGISLLVDFEKDFCFQRHIAILKPDINKLNSTYLYHMLNSSSLMKQAHNVATGTAQKTVPLRGIKGFSVSLPTIEEQTEIVSQVESLFAKTDAIEAKYNTLKSQIDSLPQAILAKAFKGELVEQLDTDGDAKDLLKEIQQLKAEAAGSKKKTVKPRSHKK